jgi:hypothetical protein
MAELEIHHEHGHDHEDPLGRKIGILASVLAVFLAVVTIMSHRAHTHGVLLRTEANDRWSEYQSTRIKLHNVEVGADMITALKAADAEKILARYETDKKKYESRSDELQDKAKELEAETTHCENRALFYDVGEGLLEIGLVLTSLYFISKNVMFPTTGLIAAIAGIVSAAYGLIV